MMTLDEAIKHCEEVAENNEKTIAYYTIEGDKEWLDECEKDCNECAKEHRQLAEWLRELKAYREVEEVIFNICKEACEYPKDKPLMCGACWVGIIKDIFENLLDEFREVNADE